MAEELMTTPAAADASATGDAKAAAKGKTKVGAKKKAARSVSTGRVYVNATYNNTIVTITDPNGNVLGWSSAGSCGFKGPKKATPYAAGIVTRTVMEKIADCGLKEATVFVTGVGSGREGAVRGLHAAGVNVLAIKDVTPVPHNGCRAPKPRRV
jgi:small subunit ribosomal protein S11